MPGSQTNAGGWQHFTHAACRQHGAVGELRVPTPLLGEQPAQLAEHPGQVPDRDAASVA